VRRRWRWAALGLLLIAGTGGGLLAARMGRPAAPQRGPEPAAASAAVGFTSSSMRPPAGLPGLPLPATAASSGLPAAADKEFVEVCGLGRMKRTDLERREGEPPPAWLSEWEQQPLQQMGAVVGRLSAGSVRQRVAAAVINGDVQAAAALATSTTDAAAYRLALRACRHDASQRSLRAYWQTQPLPPAASAASVPELPPPGPLPTACAALTVEKLEALDPASAWPAVARLQDSLAQGDPAGVTQALYQFAQGQRTAPSPRALSAVLADVVGAEPSRAEATALVVVLGKDLAQTDFAHSSISRACSREALVDANRRQLCEQTVRRLPEMTTELIEAGLLHSLEQRLGLPHSAQALSQNERSRVQEALAQDSNRWFEEPSCANFAGMGRLLLTLSRHGELAHARELLKKPASAPR